MRCLRYAVQVLGYLARVPIKGIAHITGGGFTDNIPRMLPAGLAAQVDMTAWQPPPIFPWLQQVRLALAHFLGLAEVGQCQQGGGQGWCLHLEVAAAGRSERPTMR